MPDTTTTPAPSNSIELLDQGIKDHEKEGVRLLRCAEDNSCNFAAAAELAHRAAVQFTAALALADVRIHLLAKFPRQSMEGNQ